MRAWKVSGEPTEHLDPWGVPGAFSTLRLYPNGHIPFLNDYISRLVDSAKLLQQPWIPEINFINHKLDEYLGENIIKSGLIRICLF